MKRKSLLNLLLFTLLSGLCLADDDRPVLEGVYACGFLSKGNSAIGLIETEYGFKAITPGQKLGDYTVHSLSADGPFVFTVEGEEQVAEWMDMETQSSSSSSGPIQVRLEDVNCHEASQALAKLLGYSFFCDLNFAGSVSLRGAFESRLSGRSWWRRGKNKCLKASESVMPW